MDFENLLLLYFAFLPLSIGTIIGLLYSKFNNYENEWVPRLKLPFYLCCIVNFVVFQIVIFSPSSSPHFTDHLAEISTNYALNLLFSISSFIGALILFKPLNEGKIKNLESAKGSRLTFFRLFFNFRLLFLVFCLYIACLLIFGSTISCVCVLLGFSNALVFNFLLKAYKLKSNSL